MTETVYTSEKVMTRISSLQVRMDGILHIDIRADEQFEIEDMRELIAAAKQLGGGKRFRNLITVGARTVPDKEARELSTREEGSIYKIADAFVINSMSQAIVGNFYMKFHKPFAPTHFFKSESDALKWLEQFENE